MISKEKIIQIEDEPAECRYQALVAELGPLDTIRFLQQAGWGTGDYTAERQERLQHITRDDFWQDVQRLRARKRS